MRITSLLTPGMWVMRRMRLGFKLAIVLVVAVLPLVFLVWELVARSLADVKITAAEVQGVEVVQQTTDLIRLVQAHRGLTNMVLLGSASAQTARDETRSQLSQKRLAVDALLHALPGQGPPPEWAALRTRTERLFSELEGKQAAQAFATHTALVEDLMRFVYGMAEQMGLLYAQDPQAYLLMDMSVSRLIPLREYVGQLRGSGAVFLSEPHVSAQAQGHMAVLTDRLSAWTRDVAYAQKLLAAKGFAPASGDTVQATMAAFVDQTVQRFRVGNPGGDPQAYFAMGAPVIEAIGGYHTAVNEAMLSSLETRARQLQHMLYVVAGVCVLAMGALLYWILSFNLSFLADLRELLRVVREAADGNLQSQSHLGGRDELTEMAGATALMVRSVSAMVASVRSNAALVAHSGDVLVSANRHLADRTEQQAANLEETSASVQELAATVQDNSQASQQSDRTTQEVRTLAERGAADMQYAIASIEGIEASTRRMDEIVSVIDGLAFQTNILALNAAVEAARAGESGRGFAVVATEVRSLAQRSAASAKEIRQLISASSAQVVAGVAQIRTAAATMAAITDGVRQVASNMSQISTSGVEQSGSLLEITGAIQQIDQITQQNASMVEQAVQQATALQQRAEVLAQAVSVFKLQQGSADEAKALVHRALDLRHTSGQRDTFLQDITRAQTGLHDRDMYVFVLDRRGQYLAFAGNPAKVGTRVQDVPGIDGDALVSAISSQADYGPGWVEYEISNPLSGQVQTKMSYVHKLDDMYLGCGVYKTLLGH